MAKPIIATNISDIPEILDGCGWITEPENPRQLAEIIKYVFDHPVEAKEKGKKARENTKENIAGMRWRKY
jgi:glycosyltransferase involved in cell wall biosynthesis